MVQIKILFFTFKVSEAKKTKERKKDRQIDLKNALQKATLEKFE